MYEKFAKLLENKGVSAYRVSKETGISQTSLSQWKSGQYELKADKLQKIADYFNVPLSYFYDYDFEPKGQFQLSDNNSTQYIPGSRKLVELYDEVKGLSDDEIDRIIAIVKLFRSENNV